MPGEFHMRKKKSYRGIIIFSGIAFIVFATAIKFIPKKEIEKEKLPEVQEVTAVKEENNIVLSDDSAIRLMTIYNCGHINTRTKEVDKSLIGKTKKEIAKLHPEWKINEFSENFISVEADIDEPCENHYLIKLKGDTLYVYKQNNESEYIKTQKISTTMLEKEEIKELESGIHAESEHEVLKILESFIS